MVQKIYQKIISYNIEEKTQEDTFAIFTNQVSLVTMIVSIIYTSTFYFLGNYELFYKYTPFIFVYPLVIFFNSKGYLMIFGIQMSVCLCL